MHRLSGIESLKRVAIFLCILHDIGGKPVLKVSERFLFMNLFSELVCLIFLREVSMESQFLEHVWARSYREERRSKDLNDGITENWLQVMKTARSCKVQIYKTRIQETAQKPNCELIPKRFLRWFNECELKSPQWQLLRFPIHKTGRDYNRTFYRYFESYIYIWISKISVVLWFFVMKN